LILVSLYKPSWEGWALAQILKAGGYSKKNYVHDKNWLNTHQSTGIPGYVKENRYIPLYMGLLGLYMGLLVGI